MGSWSTVAFTLVIVGGGLLAGGCRGAAAGPGDDAAAADVPAPPMAWRACDRIELARPIVFSHDWTLDGWSAPAIEAAAALLVREPSIRRVRVEADDRWNDPNRGARVSQSRADTVASYLVARGVARERVEARGFAAERVTDRSGAPAGVRLMIVDPPPACPAPDVAAGDADLDGIPAAVDRCPDVAEDLDATDDADGCPEPAHGRVRIDCRAVVLDGPVRVAGKKLTLDARSRARLADLAAILRAAPFLRVVLIEERVHHDPRRQDIPPPRRSPAVEDHLVSLGVPRDRLHAVLYSMPAMPAGRYQLTFHIYERSLDCPPLAPPPAARRRR